jgi:ABC-type multidrug transport system ATPase subunit
VLTVDKVSKSYGDKSVLRGISLVVRRGEKLGVIGPNGLGKSTLLRVLVGGATADAGTVTWGHETIIGYFAQDHKEVLPDPKLNAIEVMEAALPDANIPTIRTVLGKVLFSGEDAYKRVGALSGGEAARLVFGRLMAMRPNVLVLDEPTNHLDLESIDALVAALRTYEGTVIFVSHDRRFVSDVATRILELTPEGPNDFPGTFAEYLEKCGDDHLDAESIAVRAKREKSANNAGTNRAATAEEKRAREKNAKQLAARRDKAFAAVEQAEARLAEIHARFASEGFYEKTPPREVDALVAEEAALGPTIAQRMAEWEALEAECAALLQG